MPKKQFRLSNEGAAYVLCRFLSLKGDGFSTMMSMVWEPNCGGLEACARACSQAQDRKDDT